MENTKLILHSCCAPCSTYVIEQLSEVYELIIFYYNPNIFPDEEYRKRAEEQQKLIDKMCTKHPIHCVIGEYEKERFYQVAKGLEDEPECGERCQRCYRLRLQKTAELAKEMDVSLFTTTLTISPLKKAEVLNRIGMEIAQEQGLQYLVSDFKKKNGYQRSVVLSKEYGLYRQDFCGCVYSRNERDRRVEARKQI